MTLVAIVGELGTGKTLALTYLAWHNYIRKGRKIYSNYHFKPPIKYTPVKTVDDINEMKSGIFCGDELWLWLDSRASHVKKNRFIAAILAKSRKRNLEILYTTQSFGQIDVRIRRLTDFILEPILTKSERVCSLYWYTRAGWFQGVPFKIMRFKTPLIWNMYDTHEEISLLE